MNTRGLIKYCIMSRGFDDVNINNYLIIDNTDINGNTSNGYKLKGKHFRSGDGKHYFSLIEL